NLYFLCSLMPSVPSFFLYCYAHHRHLHSFPTRRSSDLSLDYAPTRSLCSPMPARTWATCSVSAWHGEPSCWLNNHRPSDTRTARSEEHTSELQSRGHLVCRLLLEKKKKKKIHPKPRRLV